MAAVGYTITAEFEGLLDALSEIERVYVALKTRHGDSFRELERQIERLSEVDLQMTVESLGDGAFLPVSKTLSDLLIQARQMGVI